MRSKFTKGPLVVAVISLAVITMVGGLQWANSSLAKPSGQERKKRNLKEEVLTAIDRAPDELDAEKRAARTNKSKRFNVSKNPLPEEKLRDGELFGTIDESPYPPPLPVTSDLIVVGSIQRRQPYVSENMTSIYSELTVHIEDILKNNPSSLIYAYTLLVFHRVGGAIRMPDGRIFRYLVGGSGAIPEVGKRYVLFLEHEAERGYKLVCGYELTDKTIIPLEDLPDRDPLLKLTEAQFLGLLKQKISQKQTEKEN